MNIVSVRTFGRRFAKVPETLVFSDFLSSSGLRVIALIIASKSDNRAYGSEIRWPIFKVSEIAEHLHMSERSVERTVSELKKSGHLKVTKTKQGNRFEVTSTAFENDTYRGKPRISHSAYTAVSVSVITLDVSDGAFRLLLMLEATGKSWESIKIPQSKLVTYFPSTYKDRPFITDRQLNNWLRELEGVGLLTRIRASFKDQNEYVLYKEELVINGVNDVNDYVIPVLAVPGTRHTDEEVLEDIENAKRGELDFSGMSLAKEFQKKVKEYKKDKDWAEALKADDAINIPAMAKAFDKWLEDGTEFTDIYRMINLYAGGAAPDQDTPIWVDFMAKRALLFSKVREIRESEARQAYWDNLKDDTDDLYRNFNDENNVFSPMNRLADYLSR